MYEHEKDLHEFCKCVNNTLDEILEFKRGSKKELCDSDGKTVGYCHLIRGDCKKTDVVICLTGRIMSYSETSADGFMRELQGLCGKYMICV